MSTKPSALWTTGSTEVRHTGTWRSALPVYKDRPSPCHLACPVNGDIATWVGQVKSKDYYQAWLTLVDNNPFPAITGRICHHPCEGGCNRKEQDESVAICALERFVGDMALEEAWAFPQVALSQTQSIAVVGGGPAGLSAAYQLRRRGYAVTLFEARDQLGGVLRYGIPSYRLATAILDREIQRLLDLGIVVKLNRSLANSGALETLQKEFDAAYLATGATKSRALPSLDYSQPWVIDSAEFLAASNQQQPLDCGDRVVVIGGGSAAMDVARTAIRYGKQVTVLALEPEAQLPAQKEEFVEAQEEGVTFVCASSLSSVDTDENGLVLDCRKVDFKPGEKRGQFQIEPTPGSEFSLLADAIIPAIGQEVELSRWAPLLASQGPIIDTDERGQTSQKGIYAGGDLASMTRFFSAAVGDGKRGAAHIVDSFNADLPAADTQPKTGVPFSAINTHYQSQAPRHRQSLLAISERSQSFSEAQNGLDSADAVAEAGRCYSCGSCIYCDNCYYYCPDVAITRLDKGYSVKTDYCKGCGLCAQECPTGTIKMREGL